MVDTFHFFPFGGRLLRMTLFRHKSDGLGCCNADSNKDEALFEIESIVLVPLLPDASFDVEVELEPEVEEIILIESSSNSSLEVSQTPVSCVRMPVAESLQPVAIKVKRYNNIIIIIALLSGVAWCSLLARQYGPFFIAYN